MNHTLVVRGTEIGAGMPKIIAPIVGKTEAEILAQAEEILKNPVQIVEWRADFFASVSDVSATLEMAGKLRKVLGGLPLLFTLRTTSEGGFFDHGKELYTALNLRLAASGLVDFIDVEIFAEEQWAEENIQNIHRHNVLVVGSNHNFQETPPKEELVARLRKIQDAGADILKIAVMPQSKMDVAALQNATLEAYTTFAGHPMITMSMGPMGVVTRLTGEAFGSAATFGAVGQSSAPGQIDAKTLSEILGHLHNAMGSNA